MRLYKARSGTTKLLHDLSGLGSSFDLHMKGTASKSEKL